MECIRDLADDMGPGGVITNLAMIVGELEDLLNKESRCQQKGAG